MALQSLAWTRMLVVYSQGGHVIAAVTKTFDGRHPCELCKKIERAKKGESQPERVVEQDGQASFLAPTVTVMVKTEGASWKMEIPRLWADLRSEQPIAPPPRSAAV